MQATSRDAAVGQVINIATGNKITLNELLNTFCEINGIEFGADYQGVRQGDIRDSYANIEKATTVLEWQPKIEFKQGLQTV